MELKHNNNVIYDKNTCTICNSPTRVIRKSKSTLDKKTSWENESTMKLLGLEYVESQLRLCIKCFHIYRFPLYVETVIYGDRGVKFREEAYEKYYPGRIYCEKKYYQQGWFIENKRNFEYLTHLLGHIIDNYSSIERKEGLKILDFGGGDGYLGETISLISNKVMGVPCRTYCYDYHEWDKDSNSPYFNYISTKDLLKESPYDIVIVSHVLEHTSFPLKLLQELGAYLNEESIIVAAVPYEQISILSPLSVFMNYHQQLFSATSLYEALRRCNFKNIHINVYDTYYRGKSKINNIVATANMGETLQKRKYGYYLFDIYKLQNILAKEIFKRFIKRINI